MRCLNGRVKTNSEPCKERRIGLVKAADERSSITEYPREGKFYAGGCLGLLGDRRSYRYWYLSFPVAYFANRKLNT